MTKRDLVVIPVFNEAEKIAGVLSKVLETLKEWDADVAVVDDGSEDGSSEAARSFPGVTLLSHGKNRGYGRALATGFGFALAGGYGRLVTMDCDEQHQPRDIPGFLEGLGDLDLLSGSRYLADSGSQGLTAPQDRARINSIITAELRKITGWQLTDAFCGMKAYKVESLRGLSLQEDGYAMPLEFWIRAWKRGFRVAEKAVDLIYNSHDRSFGAKLDDPEARLAYYREVIQRTLSDSPNPGSGRALDRESLR